MSESSDQKHNEARREGEGKKVKVTDKRMFGPDGELREEYKEVVGEGGGPAQEPAEEPADEVAAEPTVETPGTARSRPPRTGDRGAAPPSEPVGGPGARPVDPRGRAAAGGAGVGDAGAGGAGTAPGSEGRVEIPSDTPEGASPTFYDLLSILAEPVAVYLGDVELPGGKNAENLEMARLHIDLLNVLRDKTRGNLSAEESSVLEDLLYRLRMRYVQKRG